MKTFKSETKQRRSEAYAYLEMCYMNDNDYKEEAAIRPKESVKFDLLMKDGWSSFTKEEIMYYSYCQREYLSMDGCNR